MSTEGEMVVISANTIKEIFSKAEEKGVFYPGLYEMVMLIFNCGIPRQELVGLTIGDIFKDEMEKRIVRCPAIIRHLLKLKEDGKLQKDTPLFPRYFPNKEKKFYADFKKVCICTVGKAITCAEIKHEGMKSFFLELDSIKEKELREERKEIQRLIKQNGSNGFFKSRLKWLEQDLRAYKSSPSSKYRDVATQYGYSNSDNAEDVGKIIRGWKKRYYTNQDRLEMALNDLENSCDQFDAKQLEKQIWKILYYAYHRDRKKGDKPQEWYVKKNIVDLLGKVKNWSKAGKIKISLPTINKVFTKIVIEFPEKLPKMTRDEIQN